MVVDEVVDVDVTGLTCPMPIVKLKKGMESIESNQILELHATGRGTLNDLFAWSKNAGHTILKTEQKGPVLKFWIQKK
ncbi:sulfurtransferase TusA family protein [Bacillus sp. V3B]|uniref:sulfurtransferase TusA family protein n=1 Tax=Bacillus sp. V3B TaxID=2804915 RepID=UPI00281190D6|nr:sulfurtransferase TusA family protein [Bacillus sp. V3B]MCQ6274848.1 sulfurtransferase TusA family protein [Bacillus sp. V3B]